MLSILDALSFAFRKTHIILWGIFFCILKFSLSNLNVFNENLSEVVPQIKGFSVLNFHVWQSFLGDNIYFGIALLACIFSYILIKAVSNTYGVNQKISVFGFLKTFGFLFVGLTVYYLFKESGTSFLTRWANMLDRYQLYSHYTLLISKFLFLLLFFLVFSPFILVHIMQLNGEKFLTAWKNIFKNYLFLIRVFFSIILLCVFLILPLEILEVTLAHMDIQGVLSYVRDAESGSVLALFAMLLMIGVPAGYFLWFSDKGRFFILLMTAFFIWMYTLFSHTNQVGFSFTLTTYFYLTWLLLSLHMSVLMILLPAGILNILAQGAFEIHSRFNKHIAHSNLFNGKRF